MNSVPHQFVTVDMRDLKIALLALARDRRVSVSAVVRDAVRCELASSSKVAPLDAAAGPLDGVNFSSPVKATVRLTRQELDRLNACAKGAGLSRSVFLAGLIDGVKALSSGDRADHVAALISSNAELSTLSRNVVIGVCGIANVLFGALIGHSALMVERPKPLQTSRPQTPSERLKLVDCSPPTGSR